MLYNFDLKCNFVNRQDDLFLNFDADEIPKPEVGERFLGRLIAQLSMEGGGGGTQLVTYELFETVMDVL